MAKGPVKSLNDYITNYQSGMAKAGPAYTKGIQNFNGNPMQLAATPQAMSNYQNGVMDSITSGRRANALNAADPAAWKSNAVTFGAPALATGAKKAEAKQRKKMASAPALWQAQRDTVSAMPQGHDVASATARVSAAMTLAKQAFGKS